MKILQVSNFLAPVHGGSAEVPIQLSKALAKSGHSVTVYTSNLGLDESVILPDVNVSAFASRYSFAGFNYTPGMSKKAREETGKFDIIHMHNFRTYQNIVAHRYAKKYGIPYVVQAHGSLTTYFQKGLLKRAFDIIWGNRILKDAAKVFAVTGIEAEQYRSMGVSPDRIEIVPHGIDLLDFSSHIEKGVFKKKYGIGNNQKIVLYLGRIHKMKGLGLLVKAFANIYNDHKDVKLVITGPDDGYLTTLKKLVAELGIGDGVVFTGPLYGLDKLQAYTDADVYVLPSSYEIFGITVLEAWACGKPVIVTDRCGLADIVKERAGLVVPYKKEPLREAITKILNNDLLRMQYGRQGRKLVEEKYNWTNVALQVESIYLKILTNRQ